MTDEFGIDPCCPDPCEDVVDDLTAVPPFDIGIYAEPLDAATPVAQPVDAAPPGQLPPLTSPAAVLPTSTADGVQLGRDPVTGDVSAGTFGLDIYDDLVNAPRGPAAGGTPTVDSGASLGEIATRLENPTLNIAGDTPRVDPVYDPMTATTAPQRDGRLTPNT